MDNIYAKLQYLKGMADGAATSEGDKFYIVQELIKIIELLVVETHDFSDKVQKEVDKIKSLDLDDYELYLRQRRADALNSNYLEEHAASISSKNKAKVVDVWYDGVSGVRSAQDYSPYNDPANRFERLCTHCGNYVSFYLPPEQKNNVRIQCPKCKRYLMPFENTSFSQISKKLDNQLSDLDFLDIESSFPSRSRSNDNIFPWIADDDIVDETEIVEEGFELKDIMSGLEEEVNAEEEVKAEVKVVKAEEDNESKSFFDNNDVDGIKSDYIDKLKEEIEHEEDDYLKAKELEKTKAELFELVEQTSTQPFEISSDEVLDAEALEKLEEKVEVRKIEEADAVSQAEEAEAAEEEQAEEVPELVDDEIIKVLQRSLGKEFEPLNEPHNEITEADTSNTEVIQEQSAAEGVKAEQAEEKLEEELGAEKTEPEVNMAFDPNLAFDVSRCNFDHTIRVTSYDGNSSLDLLYGEPEKKEEKEEAFDWNASIDLCEEELIAEREARKKREARSKAGLGAKYRQSSKYEVEDDGDGPNFRLNIDRTSNRFADLENRVEYEFEDGDENGSGKSSVSPNFNIDKKVLKSFSFLGYANKIANKK